MGCQSKAGLPTNIKIASVHLYTRVERATAISLMSNVSCSKTVTVRMLFKFLIELFINYDYQMSKAQWSFGDKVFDVCTPCTLPPDLLLCSYCVRRMLPNTDLSKDFLLSSLGGSVDLGGAHEREPGIENGLGLFDMFVLRWTLRCTFNFK